MEMYLLIGIVGALRKERVFILLPEWTRRWREIFQEKLGLTDEIAKDFMQDLHSKLLYLDTGSMPVPRRHLEELSEYSGLPFEIIQIDPDQLSASIRETVERMARYAT